MINFILCKPLVLFKWAWTWQTKLLYADVRMMCVSVYDKMPNSRLQISKQIICGLLTLYIVCSL